MFRTKTILDLILKDLKRDKIYENIHFPVEFTVDDWNALLKLKLGKYFLDKSILEKNKEILRTEIINYIQFYAKPEYFTLFEWTLDLYKECIVSEKQRIIKVLADSFSDISNTDMTWMTNVLIQPDEQEFSKRDKISYYFNVIDETLEGVFKSRLKLLEKLVTYKLYGNIPDNSGADFGKVIRDFPNELKSEANLFLEDPFFSISTNQWRNIAAHKSFTINKNDIVIEYGRKTIQTRTLTYDEFYRIVHWTQDIYRVIRFGQVLIYLNYMEEIVAELGETENMNIRFESSLLHIIHNMQIVGFEFVSNEEEGEVFCLNVKGKIGVDVSSSLIHASQCLDQLSRAIYKDEFVKDNFKRTKVCIVDNNGKTLASATIPIEVAVNMANGKMTLNEYINNMDFEIRKNT